MKHPHRLVASIVGLFGCALFAPAALATAYTQTNLVSDVPGLAQLTDPNLQNPWGMSYAPTGPFWISNQGTDTSTLYRDVNGVATKVALTVTIPVTATGAQGPTGQVFNSAGAAFLVGATPASFIFASLNGTISAWNGGAGTTAVVKATTPGRVYTGLAIAGTGANARLYAASSAGIDVFDSTFAPVASSGFVDNDPRLAGLVPFNVQTIGTTVYVTYAPAGRADQSGAIEGTGAVATFDTSGNLLQTLITGSKLASPWGIALAPNSFGSFGGDLLVGNFSYAVAEINAFNPLTGAYIGTIADSLGNALINSGLWGIAFGNGTSGDANTLFFDAGIRNEAHGLFGSIGVATVLEPGSLLLIGLGLGSLLLTRTRRVSTPDAPRVRSSRSSAAV